MAACVIEINEVAFDVCMIVEMEGEDFKGIETIGHHECYVGLADVLPDQMPCFGCDVRCYVCPDDPTTLLEGNQGGMDIRGKRFLRGRLAPDGQDVPNRNALNQRSDLKTNEPELVPSLVHYERASCNEQVSYRECFGHHVCGCWNTPSPFTDGGHCGPTSIDQPMWGLWPDTNFYHLNEWPPEIQCRRFLEQRDLLVFARSRNHQTVFLGSGHDLCPTNNLVACAARVPPSQCDDYWCNGWTVRPGFYIDVTDPSFGLFDTASINANVVILPIETETPDEQAQRQIKNAALSKVFDEGFVFPHPGGAGDGTDFLNLDHRHPIGGEGSELGHYSRFWSGAPFPLHELPALDFDLSETRTRFGSGEDKLGEIVAGCLLDAEIVIFKVEVDMYLYLEHTKTLVPGSGVPVRYTKPYVVIEVGIWLTVRASIPVPATVRDRCMVAGVPFELTNSDTYGPLPTVTPDGNQIRYANEDAAFIRIPKKVEWKGWLANRSHVTKAAERYTGEGFEPFSHCQSVWLALGTFNVGGLSTHLSSDTRDPVKVYGGTIAVGF